MKNKITLLFIVAASFSMLQFKLPSTSDSTELDQLVDNWHLAASQANFDNYFKLVSENFVFLGTDPNERWERQAF
uniref:nuclear transport factor 2 family protein n=1 Tax=Fluviicola sp. TaxID=1917219 RepID=UPI00404AE195